MKFKGIKKKIYKKKSPSNSRSITENLAKASLGKRSLNFLRIYEVALRVFVVIVFLATAIIVGLDLYDNWQKKQEVDYQRKELVKELRFWEDFIAKNSNFRDAYFQAAILEYKLGDNIKAKKYLQQGLTIDPNSDVGRKIEKLLK